MLFLVKQMPSIVFLYSKYCLEQGISSFSLQRVEVKMCMALLIYCPLPLIKYLSMSIKQGRRNVSKNWRRAQYIMVGVICPLHLIGIDSLGLTYLPKNFGDMCLQFPNGSAVSVKRQACSPICLCFRIIVFMIFFFKSYSHQEKEYIKQKAMKRTRLE